jgi:hypothetical protein
VCSHYNDISAQDNMKNAASLFGGLFVLGLIALSYGASQHNGTVTIVGAVIMLTSGIGGFVVGRNKK